MEKLKELREKTGAGISDCKIALAEAQGDMAKAIEILRKKGIAKAAKRSDREANQGIIKVATSQDGKQGFILEINAETDFVVRSEKFQIFSEKVLNLIMEKMPKNLDELMILDLNGSCVKDALENLSGVIGEKLNIKRFNILNGATVVAYSHAGGKIGVIVALNQTGKKDLALEIAMQIAALNAKYINIQDIPADEVAKEKEIYNEQLEQEGKPENLIAKIIQGKLAKFYQEACLLEQEYIKDDSKRVKDILGDVKVEKFIRYSL